MEAIPTDLARAARRAREHLSDFARRAASATTPGATTDSAAAAARSAIFTDAVLAAMHARLQAFKIVAK